MSGFHRYKFTTQSNDIAWGMKIHFKTEDAASDNHSLKKNRGCLCKVFLRQIVSDNMSSIMKSLLFCICKNKGPDQQSSVAVQSGLCQSWSETKKNRFSHDVAHI